MSAVRPFREQDIPEVAGLWLRIFRRIDAPAPPPLQAYFRELLFESPWADATLPSLVYEERGLGIAGFLGVMPRAMSFRGEPVRAAVATQLMVNPRARGYPGARLLRRFFAGPQDLSFSDGANEFAERLWRSCGGSVALLYSLNWTRVLRPARFALAELRRRAPRLAPALRALGPLAGAVDGAAARTPVGVRWLPARTSLDIDTAPDDRTLLWCIRNLDGNRALRPDYDLAGLSWLLRRAAEKRMHGTLYRAVARLPGGDIAGWFLYYLAPEGVAQVLQFGARPRSAGDVLASLFRRARAQGALAVSGELEPRYMKELARARCRIECPGYGVVVAARRPEILDAVHAGDAFLTRLEGEWWARFSDPDWSQPPPGPRAADGRPASGDTAPRAAGRDESLLTERKSHERATA